jgi:L-amino acid N-acyltransferase YncA
MILRLATQSDENAIWDIFHALIASGDTYVFDPEMSRSDALAYWFRSDTHVYVAESDGRIVGTYILKPNQPALGLGIGRRMGEHCLDEARRLGFRAMQFNFVVSTNAPAVRLWRQFGFSIVGTLPGAFRHSQLGFVDSYVMFRTLEQ